MLTFNMIFIVFSTMYWPIRNFNGPHPISATFGDTRGENVSRPRFHRAIDIPYPENTDTIVDFSSGAGIFWSPDRQKFICYDGNWFAINRNGTNRWYLQP